VIAVAVDGDGSRDGVAQIRNRQPRCAPADAVAPLLVPSLLSLPRPKTTISKGLRLHERGATAETDADRMAERGLSRASTAIERACRAWTQS